MASKNSDKFRAQSAMEYLMTYGWCISNSGGDSYIDTAASLPSSGIMGFRWATVSEMETLNYATALSWADSLVAASDNNNYAATGCFGCDSNSFLYTIHLLRWRGGLIRQEERCRPIRHFQ